MKHLFTLLLSLIVSTASAQYQINECFTVFKNAEGLTWTNPDHLPLSPNVDRNVETANGDAVVTRIEGYRVIYENDKGAPFVNLKVELSEKGAYESDKKAILANLSYLNSKTQGSETEKLIELEINGYKIYGSSRSAIERGMFLGTFVIFPGNGVTLYVYFKNINQEYRHFNSFEGYKRLRNQFFEEYTKYIKQCN